MERAKSRIAIIGGGISGLTAAYEINKAIQKEQLPFKFILLERTSKLGGMIKTIEVDGHAFDVGAASFDIRRQDIRSFLEELGLASQIQYSKNDKKDRYNGHEFIYTDKPTYHGIPIRRRDILYDRGLSFHDKVKVLFNGIFNKKKRGRDPSITTLDFLEYRFCKEVANFIAYAHYPENIYGSMEICPPSFFDANLIDLFEYSKDKSEKKEEWMESYRDSPGKEFHLRDGMEVLVDRLTGLVEEHIETGKQVTGIQKLEQGILLLKVNETEEIRVGSVISTIPLSEIHQILDEKHEISSLIPKPTVSSMCTVFFKFEKSAITKYPRGTGFVIPKRSSFHITKATFLNQKWPSFQDSMYEYLVVEFGRRQEETLIQLADEAIISIIERELSQIIGLKDTYQFARVFRWQHAVPHLKLEDRQALENNEEQLVYYLENQGILIGGNGLHGYGLPNAIGEGQRLAQAAISYMRQRKNSQLPLMPPSKN